MATAYFARLRPTAAITAIVLGPMCAVVFSAPTLTSLVDQGSSAGRHYFELWGSFPGDQYIARVVCNGAEVPSRREYHAAAKEQINISIEDQRSDTSCSVMVQGRTGASVEPSNALPPQVLRAPPLEITGIRDQGVTQGRRYFELYGKLNGQNQSVAVACNGKTLPTTVSWAGTGRPDNSQINIAVSNYPAAPAACDLTVRGRVAGRAQASPVFHHEHDVAPELLPSFLGIYFWGGYQVPPGRNQIGLGAADLLLSGFSTLRLIMTPRVRGEAIQGNGLSLPYGFSENSFRCPDKTFLACAAASEEYRSAIGNAQAKTVILTAYDAAASGDAGWNDGYLRPEHLYEHNAAIVEEYRSLTLELHRQYANTGKTFIISNWEADNHVYCGSPAAWSREPGKRLAECATAEKVKDRLAAIGAWFQLRQIGIRRGVEDARAENLAGITVEDGIEFNAYEIGRQEPGNVLSYVIPRVIPAWALYSSYETINKIRGGGGQSRVSSELRLIKRHLVESSPGTQLIIGEAGFRATEGGANQVRFTVDVVRAFYDADVPTVVLWVAYDSTPQCHPGRGVCDNTWFDGFVNRDGRERWNLKNLRAAVGSWPDRPRLRLDRATAGMTNDGKLTVVLNGTFPGADRPDLYRYQAKAICDGNTVPDTPLIPLQTPTVVMAKMTPWRACSPGPCQASCQFVVHRVSVSPLPDDYTQSMRSLPVAVTW